MNFTSNLSTSIGQIPLEYCAGSSDEEYADGEDQTSNSSGDRWDPNILAEMDYTNVFVENGDEQENLPGLPPKSNPNFKKKKLKNCYLCHAEFKMLKPRKYCN